MAVQELKYFSVNTREVETLTDKKLVETLLFNLEHARKLFPIGLQFVSLINSNNTNTIKSHEWHRNTLVKNGSNWYINFLVEDLSFECDSWAVIRYTERTGETLIAKTYVEKFKEDKINRSYTLEEMRDIFLYGVNSSKVLDITKAFREYIENLNK